MNFKETIPIEGRCLCIVDAFEAKYNRNIKTVLKNSVQFFLHSGMHRKLILLTIIIHPLKIKVMYVYNM